MDWLNYHHLYYFWVVAREGSLRAACEQLHLAQPTVSAQIKKLESALGEPLFIRTGRRMTLSEFGQVVQRYAEEIFAIGRELEDVSRGQASGRPQRLVVGAPEVIPKLIVHRLLLPALEFDPTLQVVCREGKLDYLLEELAAHRVDLVLSDAPITSLSSIRAFNHDLGESTTSIYGTAALVKERCQEFPMSLHAAPMLLPTRTTSLRRAMDRWFDDNEVRPLVRAEFDDSALMKVFAQTGLGLFPGPTAISTEITRQYNVQCLGELTQVKEHYYAISIDRRIKHPAVRAIQGAARDTLFA